MSCLKQFEMISFMLNGIALNVSFAICWNNVDFNSLEKIVLLSCHKCGGSLFPLFLY